MDMYKKVLLSCATLAATSVAFAGGDKDYDRELVMRDDEEEEEKPRVYREREDEEDNDNFFEVLVFGGVAAMQPEHAILEVSDSENDLLTNANGGDWDSWTVQAGIGYAMNTEEFFDDELQTGDLRWFSEINPQINVYYLDAANLHGDALMFGNINYDYADWNMDFNSTRVMFDLALTVASLERLSLYVLGGAGIAFNRTQLDSIAHPGTGIADVDLSSQTSTSFAWEFGGGLTYALMDDLAVSLQYLFTGIQSVKLGSEDALEGQAFNVQGENFDMDSQAVMLGLRLAI